MASLVNLLASQQTQLKTKKGLLLIGLQNDFLSRDGIQPVQSADFTDRLPDLLTAFRDEGRVIWARSEYDGPGNRDDEGTDVASSASGSVDSDPGPNAISLEKLSVSDDQNSPISKRQKTFASSTDRADKSDTTGSPRSSAKHSDDESLVPAFLLTPPGRELGCARGTTGADYPEAVSRLIDRRRDIQIVKSQASAFVSTALLATLRSQLVTELFICGCLTSISVYATALEAPRYGIKIYLVEDCMGYISHYFHHLAIRRLKDVIEAEVMTSRQVLAFLKNPPEDQETSEDEEDEDSEADEAPEDE